MEDTPGIAPAPSLADRPAELLRALVRFDTTNPPGEERACVEWIESLLSAGGLDTETYARDPERPNLVARLPGGDADPLMLYGHVDVVPTAGQDWTHPPFAGVVEDGWVWGRGTLDMKGGVAMMLAAALRAARAEEPPAGDVVVAVLADEEAGGEFGARYLVEEHPEVFDGVEHALGEFGGFSTAVAGERLYPIQTAEKVSCEPTLTFSGPGGHASRGSHGGAMVDMARAVTAIDGAEPPVRVVEPVRAMVEAMADAVDDDTAAALRAVLDPERSRAALADLGDAGDLLAPLVSDTLAPTVVRGGDKANVIPGEVELTLDARLLPGRDLDDLRATLRAVVPEDVDYAFDAPEPDPAPTGADDGLFDLLAGVLEDADPGATAVPLTLFATTDARHLARAGVRSYGFTPMRLPPDFAFLDTVHAADERVPVDAVEFGADRVAAVLDRYDGVPAAD